MCKTLYNSTSQFSNLYNTPTRRLQRVLYRINNAKKGTFHKTCVNKRTNASLKDNLVCKGNTTKEPKDYVPSSPLLCPPGKSFLGSEIVAYTSRRRFSYHFKA